MSRRTPDPNGNDFIVLVEDDARLVRHNTQAEAEREASRLARLHPGQSFRVFGAMSEARVSDEFRVLRHTRSKITTMAGAMKIADSVINDVGPAPDVLSKKATIKPEFKPSVPCYLCGFNHPR